MFYQLRASPIGSVVEIARVSILARVLAGRSGAWGNLHGMGPFRGRRRHELRSFWPCAGGQGVETRPEAEVVKDTSFLWGEPVISVVIPHLNQPDLLAICLDALARQSFDPDRTEILVVDNGSRTPPTTIVAQHPGMRLVAETEPGPGPARNHGVALSRASLIAFTDADCIPEPDWLAQIVERFRAEPEIGILGGEVRVFAADPLRPTSTEAFDMVYGFRQARQIAKQNFAATANLAVRRKVFEAIGPFAGISVAEDMEWGQRAARKGFPTRFVPEALVRHPARRAMADLRRQWDRHIDHHHTMQLRQPMGHARWLLGATMIAASPLAEIPTLVATDRLAGTRARLLAFAGLANIRFYRAGRMASCMLPSFKRSAGKVWNRS
jgi:GT2 family glycosyltransferase